MPGTKFGTAHRGYLVHHGTQSPRGFVNVKLHKQRICNPRLERELIPARFLLKTLTMMILILSSLQFLINLQSNNTQS